jgi:hypothetical protein
MRMGREGIPNASLFQNRKAHNDLAGLHNIRMNGLEDNTVITRLCGA